LLKGWIVDRAPCFRRRSLEANLRRAGIAPDSIDLVVTSHGHLDHIGGLVTKSGALTFPKAQFVPFTDPDAAERKIVELAHGFGPVQDGGIYIEKSNGPFLLELKGTPAGYKARLERSIANGWLWLHESGAYVKFTEPGAALFA
jgi:glyoxylase-like metal-dependent hydrolase (beta-lactamase superfamily II)